MSSSPTETLTQVHMPQMGISVSEGTILEWRKQVGDAVEADETIADVTTDKVDVEIPCPASGVIASLLVEAGETVAVGTPIAEIRDGSAAGPVAGEDASPDSRPGSSASGRRPPPPHPRVRRIGPRSIHRSFGALRVSTTSTSSRSRGPGIGGRVRKRDLVAFIGSSEADAGKPAERPLHIESPYVPDEPDEPVATNGAEPAPAVASDGGRREPMSAMRQAIARHMVDSRHTAAHCTTIVEVDMHRVASAALRAEGGDEPAGRAADLPGVRRPGDGRGAG